MTPEALATLLSDPSRADALPRDEVPELLGRVEQLRAVLWAKLTRPESTNGATTQRSDIEKASGDRMLAAAEVAEMIGTDTRYVYRHADGWPFTRRLSKGTVRFSEKGLHCWLDRT